MLLLFGIYACNTQIRYTLDNTQFINKLPLLHGEDTIVIIKPFYMEAAVRSFQVMHNFYDSGFDIHVTDAYVRNQMTEKDVEKSKRVFSNFFGKHMNCYVPNVDSNYFEQLRGHIKLLKEDIKHNNLTAFKIPDDLYNDLVKFQGNYFLICDAIHIHNFIGIGGGGHPQSGTLTRIFIIEKKTRMVLYYNYATIYQGRSPNFKRLVKKIKNRLPD